MTRPTPSDLAHQALQRARRAADQDVARKEIEHRRYQNALASALAETRDVYQYWIDAGHTPTVAAILTQTTLDNLPEGI